MVLSHTGFPLLKTCHSDDYFVDKPYIYIHTILLEGIHVCHSFVVWCIGKVLLRGPYPCHVSSTCSANFSSFYSHVTDMFIIPDFTRRSSLAHMFFRTILAWNLVCVFNFVLSKSREFVRLALSKQVKIALFIPIFSFEFRFGSTVLVYILV
jgi:hypothetical protein